MDGRWKNFGHRFGYDPVYIDMLEGDEETLRFELSLIYAGHLAFGPPSLSRRSRINWSRSVPINLNRAPTSNRQRVRFCERY
jgi:hypothetical protein